MFPHWAVTVPAALAETFVTDDSYWHAWDEHRSVSLTSVVFTDKRGRLAPGRKLLRRLPKLPGEPVAMPPGFSGHATFGPATQPARASSALSGLIVVDGYVLIVTVTSDDRAWATRVWESIRWVPGTGVVASDTTANDRTRVAAI